MGKNLETLGIMGKRTAKFDVDILSVIVGSFVFPSYCRTQRDKTGEGWHYNDREDIVTADGTYIPEANWCKTKSDFALMLGIIGTFASLISQVSYASKGDINDMVYGGSLFLGANALSGLYEWFRATRNSDPEEKMFLPGSLIDKKSVEELAEIYSQIEK